MTPTSISDNSMIEFLAECEDLTQRLSSNFDLLEKNKFTQETIDSTYRDIHSLKGAAQLFGFKQLGDLAHGMESSLEPVRNKEVAVSPILINTLFKCMDLIDRMVTAIRTKQETSFKKESEELLSLLIKISLNSVKGDWQVFNEFPKIIENLKIQPESAPQSQAQAQPQPQPQPQAQAQGENLDKDTSSTVRVPVSLLDRLMTLMGEMVLVRNQVLQYSSRSDDLAFLNLSQRLNIVTSELQAEMMKTRMQPIGNVMNKFTRVVRDLAKELGKKIDLHLVGSDTELDKTLLEAVKDPLTHIIRNSCDHGIEMPEERKKSGKPEVGSISVRSFHEGGQVIVEVSDDGKGLHRERILEKALEKGLISQEKSNSMNNREVFNLIFAPGFSTAPQVTNLSGRGVGMDVVKSNIERIGGVVELSSIPGTGTTICLKIPLTLAIVPAMIVRCENDRYAIPQVKLVELVRVEKNSDETGIEFLQGQPVYRLRGNLLPLVDLKGVLRFPKYESNLIKEDVVNIVVVTAERQYFGLIVDEILDTADIVVKPLNRFLKPLSIYAGATVLGDGSVAIILDVLGIAHQNHLIGEKKEEKSDSTDARLKEKDAQEFLLFRLKSGAKHAILLSYVHRLEEFKRSAIEYSGGQKVVRYRNSILPLISLNKFLHFDELDQNSSEIISVIVMQRGDQFFGFEVDEILDVFSTAAVMDTEFTDRPGLLGNLVTNQEIIVVVDPVRITSDISAVFQHSVNRLTSVGAKSQYNILYAEDMAFFRRQVSSVLEKAGHTVISVSDGKEAVERLAGNESFDLVLSDIEMPRMTGIQLAEFIRNDLKQKDLPLIALTTRSDQKSIDEGIKAGFNIYLEKMNPEELVNAIQKVVSARKKVA